MAFNSNYPEIISPREKGRAREVVEYLHDEELISVDSEGVHLGKDGPLTLLQIGTLDGQVYLFDVMLNEREQDRSFFEDTGLDTILTSTEIIKVIHSCSGDSAALFHQFGIRLDNVFDTQVAHLVIEEHNGRILPSRLKLAEICTQYSENAEVYEGKDELKMEWSKEVGNFWAIRPMTDRMIEYASCDVTALIPEVFETQKSFIVENGLLDKYLDRVLEEIELNIVPEQKERRNERNQELRVAILARMDQNYPHFINFESITDDDEKKAIQDTRPNEMEEFSEEMMRLKREYMATYLNEIEQEMETPESFNPHRSVWYKLGEIERYGFEDSMKKASSLKQQLIEMVLDDINRKYTSDTRLEWLGTLDCQVLKFIKPIGDTGTIFPDTILVLHWKLVERELDEESKSIKEDPDYDVRMSFGKLKFYVSNGEVPYRIKAKASALKVDVEKRILTLIPRKYTADSNIEDLSGNEQAILGSLQVGRIQYHPVVLALHWKITYERLCKDFQDLLEGTKRMNDGLRRKLNFLKGNSKVPRHVQEKAKEVLARVPSGRR